MSKPRFVSPAARRYAQAIFSLALEQEDLETWGSSLRMLAHIASEPGAQALFESRRVPLEEKARILVQSLDGAGPMVRNLVRMLLQRDRLRLAPQIAAGYEELVDDFRGVARANVASAVAMSDEARSKLEKALSAATGKQVIVEPEQDASIVGGLTIRIGDQLIDLSVRTRLQALRRRLEGAQA